MSFHSNDPSWTRTAPSRAMPRARSLSAPPSGYRNGGKRLVDLALCLAVLPIVTLVIVVLAGLIGLTGQRPFYCQNRVGQRGRIFRMWKLRSMVSDSDAALKSYLAVNPAARAEWRRYQKLGADPRVTRIGAILRRTSLDELPQFWNVIKGEMSLVGPRPMLIFQQPLYYGTDYYDLRPGISGNWQVSKRSNSAFAERAVFDTEYNAGLSLRADLHILWRTIGVVVRATGC